MSFITDMLVLGLKFFYFFLIQSGFSFIITGFLIDPPNQTTFDRVSMLCMVGLMDKDLDELCVIILCQIIGSNHVSLITDTLVLGLKWRY